MKPLYYAALAPPAYALPLSRQVHESLRPLVAYLNSAKRAAREREARSWVRWEPVPVERALRLEPLDSLVEIAAEGFTYCAVGWSGAPPSMPLFVGASFRPVQPIRVQSGPDGPLLILAEEVAPGEQAYWAGQRCELRRVPGAVPAHVDVRGEDGGPRVIRYRFEVEGTTRLVIEGKAPVTLLGPAAEPIAHTQLPPEDGAQELRTQRTRLPWTGDRTLTVKALPDEDILTADNAVRWRWWDGEERGRRRRGVWIQLLAAEGVDVDATVDPRLAYCEEGVRSVRTEKGGGERNEYKVFGARRDSYRIELDRLPPDGSQLFLPANLGAFQQQLSAVYRLKDSPLPHHRGLLKLCEEPTKAHWTPPSLAQIPENGWYLLKDARYDGTDEQREFVLKALGTEDFAFLEGPPGSGKTHAICELVLQLIARDKRVLLCSTTHVAVDNVLERLIGDFPQVEAVRIGKADRIDHRVSACRLEERVDALCALWEKEPALAATEAAELEKMALGAVLASANLTCGTTTGILRHPYLESHGDSGVSGWPHFDVLIVDEASKTTLHEFLVPAQLARRWVVVGDVRQLPPFTEPKDLEASLAEISDDTRDAGGGRLSDAHQRACLIFAELEKEEAGGPRRQAPTDPPVRWLIDEPEAVLEALLHEVTARTELDGGGPCVVRVVERATHPADLTINALREGADAALTLLAANWVLVSPALLPRVERLLPGDLLSVREAGASSVRAYRHGHWVSARGRLERPIPLRRKKVHAHVDELLKAERAFFREQSWAKQIAWRLGRVHQLGRAKRAIDRDARQEEIERLLPAAPQARWVAPAVDAIRDVGVRSVIEALRVPRSNHRVRAHSALTDALPDKIWAQRAKLLTRQHRMHPDISAFPRAQLYEGEALHDANTLDGRDARVGWSFFAEQPSRRVWVDVPGHDERGVNPEEVEAMRKLLEVWRKWAERNRRRDGRPWEVACLSFYNRQELAIRDMLRKLTSHATGETRFELPNTRLACATVDRFQGREADLVLLSFRNVDRPGHADSPNRLNVAITRARFQLVLFGRKRYFESCPSDELAELARATPIAHPFAKEIG